MAAKWELLHTETISAPVSNFNIDISGFSSYKNFALVYQDVDVSSNTNTIEIHGSNGGTRNTTLNMENIYITSNSSDTTQYFNTYATNGQLQDEIARAGIDNTNASSNGVISSVTYINNLNDAENVMNVYSDEGMFIQSTPNFYHRKQYVFGNSVTMSYDGLYFRGYNGSGTINSGKILLYGFNRN